MSKISDLVDQLDLAHKDALAIRDDRIQRQADHLAVAGAKIADARDEGFAFGWHADHWHAGDNPYRAAQAGDRPK